jgi:hypothetical protein
VFFRPIGISPAERRISEDHADISRLKGCITRSLQGFPVATETLFKAASHVGMNRLQEVCRKGNAGRRVVRRKEKSGWQSISATPP